MRKSSLEGLQELWMHHSEEILGLHLAGLIEGTARLMLDEEKDVRKGALKLLNSILTQVKHFENFNVTYICRHYNC
jgi:hypothetical protein